MLVEYAYLFLRLIFNNAQLRFYHWTNGQCYPPILGPASREKLTSKHILKLVSIEYQKRDVFLAAV